MGQPMEDFPAFLLKHFPAPTAAAVGKKGGARASAHSAARPPVHAALIQRYREFLLKDCGEMTIEGVRAGHGYWRSVASTSNGSLCR